MAKGGKRIGAGAKKGSTHKIKTGKIAKDYGPKLLMELGKMLNGSNKADKKWAIHEMMPYAIQKQPQAIVGDPNNPVVTKVIVEFVNA